MENEFNALFVSFWQNTYQIMQIFKSTQFALQIFPYKFIHWKFLIPLIQQ